MPAFNAAETVSQAVLSTLRAMPRDSELIVFDDKSTDNTLSVLESISDNRLRLLASPVNVGGGCARNLMIDQSDGEFIAAMDADDIALPWRFHLQLRAVESADAVFGSAVLFGEGIPRPSVTTTLNVNEMPTALLFHYPVWHPSMLARRTVFEKVGMYVSERQVIDGRQIDHAEDYNLWLRIAESGQRVLRIAAPVIAYRLSPHQTSRRTLAANITNQRLQRAYLKLFNSIIRNAELNSETESIVRKIEEGLQQHLSAFRLINRPYYSLLLRTGRTRNWLNRIFPPLEAP